MKHKDMLKAAKMKKHNFPQVIVDEFEDIIQNEKLGSVMDQRYAAAMEKHLTEEQRLLLWEYGGSCRGGETGRQAKLLKTQLAGKPIAEKIALMNKNDHMYPTRLNSDGTITAWCGCHCLQHRISKPETEKHPMAYGCAAGAALYNLKTALDVSAKIKSIDYPKKNDGVEQMTFVFEIA